jgi:hypothetical protein
LDKSSLCTVAVGLFEVVYYILDGILS